MRGCELVAAAGEARLDGVEDERLGVDGEARPGLLREVAEDGADGEPLLVAVGVALADVQTTVLLPAHRRVGVVVVVLHRVHGLLHHRSQRGRVAQRLHGVLVVDDGEPTPGQGPRHRLLADPGGEHLAHQDVVAVGLIVLASGHGHGLLSRGAGVGLDDDHVATVVLVHHVEEVGARPAEQLGRGSQNLKNVILGNTRVELCIASGNAIVA